jgi:hypothetical protein
MPASASVCRDWMRPTGSRNVLDKIANAIGA